MSSNTGAATSPPTGSTSPTQNTSTPNTTSRATTTSSSTSSSSTTSSTSSTSSSSTTSSTSSSSTTSSSTSQQQSTLTTTSIVRTTAPPSTVTAPPDSTSSSIPPSSSTSSSSTQSALLSGNTGSSSGNTEGLSNGGKIAIAVVVPVVVVALLLLLGIFCFRKRKAKKSAEEERRNEIAEYGFNPNNDPTLPNIATGGSVMAEDSSGYRGWGVTPSGIGSNRKTSTTLSGGLAGAALSDNGSHAQYKDSPVSPDLRASDTHSGDALMNGQHDLMGSNDEVGALGIAPAAGANQPIKRGPSNASSAYSNGARSDNSDNEHPVPGGAIGQAYDYNPGQQYGYNQHGPYGDGSYGGGQESGMPVVRDVTARRNTRIQQGGQYQQGNSGIAQNF